MRQTIFYKVPELNPFTGKVEWKERFLIVVEK